MWERLKRWFYIEYYWRKRKNGRGRVRSSKRSVLPVGLFILTIVVLSVLLSRVIASIYRSFIPFVAGPQIADAYWASIAAALKLSLMFIGIVGISIVLVFMRLIKKRDNKKH